MAWWGWFVVAVVLSIAEALGGEFVLLMLGGGALIAGLVSLVTGPYDATIDGAFLWLQLLVFAIASLALVFGLRPQLKRHFIKPPRIRSGIDALIGSPATVVTDVDTTGGQVKIGGDVWSAVTMDPSRPLPAGTSVMVVEIRGATAVVVFGP